MGEDGAPWSGIYPGLQAGRQAGSPKIPSPPCISALAPDTQHESSCRCPFSNCCHLTLLSLESRKMSPSPVGDQFRGGGGRGCLSGSFPPEAPSLGWQSPYPRDPAQTSLISLFSHPPTLDSLISHFSMPGKLAHGPWEVRTPGNNTKELWPWADQGSDSSSLAL